MKDKKRVFIISSVILSFILLFILTPMIYYKANYIGKEKVKEIIISYMDKNKNEVYFDSIDFDLSKEYYAVELYYQNKEYEFKIDAKKGNMIYTDYLSK